MRAWRFAGPASGISAGLPETRWVTSIASPTAKMSGSEVARPLVDLDAAGGAELEPRFARELGFRPHADRDDDDVGLDALAARQEHDDMVGPILEVLDLVVEVELDRLVAHMGMDDRGHLLVERREDLRRAFDHGGEKAALVEVLGDFEADVAAADHHRPARLVLRERRHDAIEIGDVVQGEDALRVDAGNPPRPDHLGAGGQQQPIVRLVRLGPGFEIAQAHGLGGAVDRQRLGAGAHVDMIARLEQRFLGDEKLLAFGDGAGDVIGQAAIGEADVGPAFDEDDLGRFADSAQARRRGGAAGDAPDDDNLHDALFFAQYAGLPARCASFAFIH